MAFLLISLLLLTPGCKTSNTIKGAAIGGAVGGVVGGAIGKSSGKTGRGILIGSVLGGTAGALIGNYMDKQAKEIREDMRGAKVERVGEGILITFDSGLLFDVNSSQLRPATRDNLEELARILLKYEDTDLIIDGHTDSTGPEDYNQELSEKRAEAVAYYLVRNGVGNSRIITYGYGETEPIADNASERGRQTNRRVEVAIVANKKLQRAAKRGDIGAN